MSKEQEMFALIEEFETSPLKGIEVYKSKNFTRWKLKREHHLSPEQRKSLRLEKALPVINEFAKWMFQQMKHQLILPKSPIGKAFRYSMNRWISSALTSMTGFWK